MFEMPLSTPTNRQEIHHRDIDMRAFARADGLFDVEARLIDTKPFAFERLGKPEPVPAGQSLHDLCIRMTVDSDYVVRAMEASSDVTPYALCKEAESTLQALVGEKLAKGWAVVVKDRLRGAAGCTHLREMLLPMATTAIQGIRGMKSKEARKTPVPGQVPAQIDSCYAYGRTREVVRWLWPDHAEQGGGLQSNR
jgi:Protein of unknown function (DUF2889)